MKPFFLGDNLKTRLIAVILFGVIVFKFLYQVPTERILTEEYFKFDNAVVLQPPTIGQKYSVFSGSTPLARDLTGFNYVFYLPMTAMAWRRIGYGSIIVITGEFKSWKERKELNIILKEILSVNATVVFLPCKGDRTEILATNFGCCGKFTFNGNRYDMLAMSTIAMSVEKWREVILPGNSSKAVKTSGDIMQYVVNMFPDNDVHSVVQKGSSEWFIDQKLVSVRVAHWVKDRDRSVILLKNRMTVYDRVDRINWNTQQLDRKVDAHLPLPGFDVNWNKIEPLLDFLYKGRDFVEWMKIKKYKEKFVKAINTQNSSETNTQTQDHLRKKSLLRT